MWNKHPFIKVLSISLLCSLFTSVYSQTFTEVSVGLPSCAKIDWGDYDNDGDLDILAVSDDANTEFSVINQNNSYIDTVYQMTLMNIGLAGVKKSSAAWGDYDNDGDLDIILSGCTDNNCTFRTTRIYRNDSNNVFTDIAATIDNVQKGSTAWGDYDGDGDLDILLTGCNAIACTSRTSTIYRNDGSDTFTDINAGIVGVSEGAAAWADYDNDGDLDFVLTGDDGSSRVSSIYRNDSNTTFTDINATLTAVKHSAVSWADFDNDNDLDLLIAGQPTAATSTKLYRNDGSDVFTFVSTGLPNVAFCSIESKDYDQDGDIDILIQGQIGVSNIISRIYRNDSNFIFTDINAGFEGLYRGSASWEDVDNDGDLDVLITGFNTSINKRTIYYRYDGGNSFTAPLTPLPDVGYSSAVLGDYDNDNDMDVLVTGWDLQDQAISYLYRNENVYSDTMILSYDDIGAGLQPLDGEGKWGDYDNDGDLDVLIAGWYNGDTTIKSKIYRNDSNNVFTDINAPLFRSQGGSCDWGDYDNDGDLDVFITGLNFTGKSIFRNDGNDLFVNINTGIPTIYQGEGIWGDCDNDGDLDILLTGSLLAGGSDLTQVFRNDSNDIFTGINFSNFISPYNGRADWGDYDNDGILDLIITGSIGNVNAYSYIYRNDGTGLFTYMLVPLMGLHGGDVRWGDYDNDGDLDLLIAGDDSANSTTYSQVYRNDGNNVFTNINAGFEGIYSGSATWIDIDEDGDLDACLSGFATAGLGWMGKIYLNHSNTPDLIPPIPTNRASVVNNDKITLSWDAMTQPNGGLSYNIYVGTQPQGIDIVSPMADVNSGYRKIIDIGNTQLVASHTIENLAMGTYYWSVQSIDNNFKGSAFAVEDSFIITYCPATSSTVSAFACESYIVPSGDTSYSTSGTFIDTIPNSAGCDSTITINLTVNNTSTGSTTETACGTYTAPDSAVYTSTGMYTATIPNAAGCDSTITIDLTVNTSTASSITETVCDTYTAPDGTVYNTTGMYTAIIPNAAGCDSVITLNLTINTVNIGVVQNQNILTSSQTGGIYQWVQCPSMSTLPGENSQILTATFNSDYAVIVTYNGCLDTSTCYTVSSVAIIENDFGNGLLIYPNPTDGDFSIDLGANYESVTITLTDINGKLIQSNTYNESQLLSLKLEETTGVYLLIIESEGKKAIIRLVKE